MPFLSARHRQARSKLRRTTTALKRWYIAITSIALIIAALRILVPNRRNSSLDEDPPHQILTISESTDPAVLEVGRMAFSTTRSGERQQVRSVLPDGRTQGWVNIRGEVVAGLRLNEVEVTGGSLPFTRDALLHLRAPRPQLVGTYPDFTSIETGFSSNLFTSNPDEEKTQLREELVEDAIASAMRDAGSPETIAWAEQCAADALTRISRLIGYSRVEVSFEDSAIRTETDSTPIAIPGRREETMPSATVSNRIGFLVLAAAAVVGTVVIPRLNLAELFRNSKATSFNSPDNANSAESVLLRGLQRMASIGCGNYSGAAYVRETVPLRLFGIRLSDATVWLHAPGTARASIDLSGLTQSDVQVRSTDTGRAVTISRVPPPRITGCEIDLARTIRGRTPFLPWGGNSRAVAEASDRLIVAAQDTIRIQALRSGLLEQARDNARAAITNLIRQILGESTEVVINFGQPPEHHETSPWEIGLCDASRIRGAQAIR